MVIQYWTLALIKSSLPSARPFFPFSTSSLPCLPETRVTLTQQPRDDFARQKDLLRSTPWGAHPSPLYPRYRLELQKPCAAAASSLPLPTAIVSITSVVPDSRLVESYQLHFSTPLGDTIPTGPRMEASLLYADLPHTGAPKEQPCEALGLETRLVWERCF